MKKQSALHVYSFIDEIYKAEIWFFYRCDGRAVQDYIRHKFASAGDYNLTCFSPPYDGAAHSIERAGNGQPVYFVWVKDRRNYYTLVHECFHLTCRIFRDRGVLLDFTHGGQEEHFAYYMDALIKGMWRLMRRADGKP